MDPNSLTMKALRQIHNMAPVFFDEIKKVRYRLPAVTALMTCPTQRWECLCMDGVLLCEPVDYLPKPILRPESNPGLRLENVSARKEDYMPFAMFIRTTNHIEVGGDDFRYVEIDWRSAVVNFLKKKWLYSPYRRRKQQARKEHAARFRIVLDGILYRPGTDTVAVLLSKYK